MSHKKSPEDFTASFPSLLEVIVVSSANVELI